MELEGLRLGVFGKGGAGKSTLTVLLARAMAEMGYRPVILDADSTNIGLARALGVVEAPDTLIEHFGGLVFDGGRVTCPVDDPTPLEGSALDLWELPGRFLGEAAGGIRVLVGGKMGDLGPGAGCDGPIAKVARDVSVRYGEENPPLLVDFKAGFEDSARGVLTGLDWALVAVDPTTASLHMAVHLEEMVRKIRDGIPPATAHLSDPRLADLARRQFRESRVRGVVAVLNRVPDRETEAYMRRRLQELGGPPVIGSLPEERTLQGQWLRGEEVGHEGMAPAARSILKALGSLGIAGEARTAGAPSA
jgi:CO dehydrogenase nickel-insertion accessory protein CooC1